jgi:hypothetical protein
VRAFFEAIDSATLPESLWVILGVVAVALIAERIFRELEFRYRAACERIDGYIHGFRDGDAHRMAAVDVGHVRIAVPPAFHKAFTK